jgi:carboxyl-terminal processing protease
MRRPWIAALLVLTAGLGAGAWFLNRAAREEMGPEPTRLFQQVFTHVRRFGVDSLSESELYRLAADGLLGQLDDEFATLVPDETPPAAEPDDPGGLGLLLSTRDDRITVLGVLPGSPAERAGIAVGDLLIDADGRSLDASRRDLLFGALTGPPGTAVTLRIRRPGVAPLAAFEVARERPRSLAVGDPELLTDSVGYLAVQLAGRGAAALVEGAVNTLRDGGARGLILDLRGTAGGDLTEAADIAGLFLPRDSVVATVRGKTPEPREIRGRRYGRFLDLPLVVLVDSTTADAGEVIAGALQDHDRALTIGQLSFGRGLSRETFRLAEGVTIRISTETWQTPAGRGIQRDTAFARDSLEGRPRVASRGGRELIGGGGILPDSIVPADTLNEALRLLLRSTGSNLSAYQAALHSVAVDIVRRASPQDDYQPARAEVSRVLDQLRSKGVVVDPEVAETAAAPLGQALGDEVVQTSGGASALVRRRAMSDRRIVLARTLLRNAPSARALVLEP